jgi:hypothetical protein
MWGPHMLRRIRIKPISDKRRAIMPERARVCREVVKRAKYKCEAALPNCMGDVWDVHERRPRSAGGDILDVTNCIAVCRLCHSFIHRNPAIAKQMGLLEGRHK